MADFEDLEMIKMNSLSPLTHAICDQNLDIVKLLIELGEKSNAPPDNAIELAVKTGNLLILKTLLSSLDVVTNNELFWAMKPAIYQGRIDMIQEMINAGANVFMIDEEGITLLMDAALSNQVEVAKLFVKLGLDINARDVDGNTALLLSAQSGNHEVFEYLYSLTSDSQEREAASLKLASSMQDKPKDLPVITPEMMNFLNSDDFYW